MSWECFTDSTLSGFILITGTPAHHGLPPCNLFSYLKQPSYPTCWNPPVAPFWTLSLIWYIEPSRSTTYLTPSLASTLCRSTVPTVLWSENPDVYSGDPIFPSWSSGHSSSQSSKLQALQTQVRLHLSQELCLAGLFFFFLSLFLDPYLERKKNLQGWAK